MGNRFALTIRFQTEGREAELYQNIQAGKEEAGLSASEYVKKMLAEYFTDGGKRDEAERVLQEIREEYRDMIARVERMIQSSIQEHDAILLGALSRMNGTVGESEETAGGGREDARLPEEGGDIPEGALDFLDGF